MPLRDLRRWHVDRYQAAKASQAQPYGRGYDAHTIAVHVSVLRRILRKAVEYGFIDANPIPETTWSRFNPPPDASFRSWSVEEQHVTFAYLGRVWRTRHPSAYVAILTQLAGGLRSGELVALEKRDIDYAVPGLWVRRSKTQGCPVKTPKSRRERFHVIPMALASEIRSWAQQVPSQILFPGRDGKYMANTTLNGWYRQLCAEAGVSVITSHGARHTTGDTYGLLGASDRMIADALGHVDAKSIERYTHHRRGAMATLGEARWAVLAGAEAAVPVYAGPSEGHLTVPKSGRERKVTLTSRLKAALAKNQHLRGERVLWRDDGREKVIQVLLAKWMRRAQRRAGLKVTGGIHILLDRREDLKAEGSDVEVASRRGAGVEQEGSERGA